MPTGVYQHKKGYHLLEGHKQGFQKGNKGYWLGKKRSIEDKEKIRKGHLGQIPWNKNKKGIHLSPKSEFTREKVCGEKNSNWKGGITFKKGYRSLAEKNREIRKKGNGGNHTLNDWETLKAQYNWTCPCCHKSEPEIKLTEDHIIPISRGGSNNIENIQPLCEHCNRKKYTKIIKYI